MRLRVHWAPGIPRALCLSEGHDEIIISGPSRLASANVCLEFELNRSPRCRPGEGRDPQPPMSKQCQAGATASLADGVDGPLRHRMCQNELVKGLRRGSRP